MKRYIRSAKRIRNSNGEIVSLERETKSLTYQYSLAGDYQNGKYYTIVHFTDADNNNYRIWKLDDNSVINSDNPYNLEKGKQYTVSGYFSADEVRSGYTDYDIIQPRIAGIKGSDGREVVMKCYLSRTTKEAADAIDEELTNNGIEHKYYDQGSDPTFYQFNILRSGKKWDDIKTLIIRTRNRAGFPGYLKFKQEKLFVDRSNGRLIFKDFNY